MSTDPYLGEVIPNAKPAPWLPLPKPIFTSPEEPKPERYPRFKELLTIMQTVHDKKGADYEGKGRPYANLRTSEDWGMEPWKMAMMRVGEKMKRLQSYSQNGSLENESAFDSLMDIAILSLIAYVLLEESKS